MTWWSRFCFNTGMFPFPNCFVEFSVKKQQVISGFICYVVHFIFIFASWVLCKACQVKISQFTNYSFSSWCLLNLDDSSVTDNYSNLIMTAGKSENLKMLDWIYLESKCPMFLGCYLHLTCWKHRNLIEITDLLLELE